MMVEYIRTLVLFMAPGFLFTAKDKKTRLNERIVTATILSTISYAAASLGLHLIGLDAGLAPWIVFAVSAAYAIAMGLRIRFDYDRALVCIVVIGAIIRIALAASQPYPVVGDSFYHFASAKSFYTDEWMTSGIITNYWTQHTGFPFPESYRPPLQDYLHYLGMLFNRADYVSAASTTLLFGVLTILVVHMIASNLADRRTADYAAALAALNFFMISRSVELEPRMFAAFYVLSMLYYYLEGKSTLASAAAALAYLTHYTTIWFSIAIVVYHITCKRANLILMRHIALALVFLVIVSPWLVRNIVLFGNPLYSTARYVPLMSSWEGYYRLTPPTFGSYLAELGGWPTGGFNAFAARAINLMTTYLPPPTKALEYGLAWTLKNSFFSLVGPLAFAAALIYLIRSHSMPRLKPILFMAAFTGVIAPLYMGYPKSDGASIDFLSPLIPVALILCGCHISKRPKIAVVVFLSVLLQTTYLVAERPTLNTTDAQFMEWVRMNIPEDAVIMSRQGHEINFYTGRNTVIPPFEKYKTIVKTAKDMGVRYYVLTKTDSRLRDIDAGRLGKDATFLKEIGDYRVYLLD